MRGERIEKKIKGRRHFESRPRRGPDFLFSLIFFDFPTPPLLLFFTHTRALARAERDRERREEEEQEK